MRVNGPRSPGQPRGAAAGAPQPADRAAAAARPSPPTSSSAPSTPSPTTSPSPSAPPVPPDAAWTAAADTVFVGDASPRHLACTQCGEAMRSLDLEGHYGNRVEVELCARCHLVWFDAFETVRLSGLGWLALLRRMDLAMHQTPGPVAAQFPCPRCKVALNSVYNATKFGRFTALECPRCRGQFRSFAQLLAERGLVRPLHTRDLAVLAEEGRQAACLNCGAPVAGTPALARPVAAQGQPELGATAVDTCAHCASPLLLLDLPRLMASLLVRDGVPLPSEGSTPLGWPCPACGAPVDPSRMSRCEACAHAVLAPSLARLRPLFTALEQRLRGHGAPRAQPQGARWRRQDGWRATALARYARHLFGDTLRLPTDLGERARWAWVGVAALLLALALWW